MRTLTWMDWFSCLACLCPVLLLLLCIQLLSSLLYNLIHLNGIFECAEIKNVQSTIYLFAQISTQSHVTRVPICVCVLSPSSIPIRIASRNQRTDFYYNHKNNDVNHFVCEEIVWSNDRTGGSLMDPEEVHEDTSLFFFFCRWTSSSVCTMRDILDSHAICIWWMISIDKQKNVCYYQTSVIQMPFH